MILKFGVLRSVGSRSSSFASIRCVCVCLPHSSDSVGGYD